ncbi:hypothetical protein QWY77_06200 [Thalassotalea ponticola]|uniref:hypothetical protein n=1 Tax=Thalassotalea ponticola TaxID=1523392 RepID=UPI0025B2F65E|nr:hypothetical protein [Thalassotalea ponticola]MDN3652352.1 hypothetical protein [Thalassotalea ponticola]
MNNDDKSQLNLADIWRSIEPDNGPTANQLERIGKKAKRNNALIFAADLLGNLVLVGMFIIMWQRGASAVVLAWLAIACVFGVWLGWQFFNIRKRSEQALTADTNAYHHYLIARANSDIKVGKLFNLANLIVTASMLLVFVIEQWFSAEPLITSSKQWLYVVCWSVTWISLMFYYGYWKVQKGKKALRALNHTQ